MSNSSSSHTIVALIKLVYSMSIRSGTGPCLLSAVNCRKLLITGLTNISRHVAVPCASWKSHFYSFVGSEWCLCHFEWCQSVSWRPFDSHCVCNGIGLLFSSTALTLNRMCLWFVCVMRLVAAEPDSLFNKSAFEEVCRETLRINTMLMGCVHVKYLFSLEDIVTVLPRASICTMRNSRPSMG